MYNDSCTNRSWYVTEEFRCYININAKRIYHKSWVTEIAWPIAVLFEERCVCKQVTFLLANDVKLSVHSDSDCVGDLCWISRNWLFPRVSNVIIKLPSFASVLLTRHRNKMNYDCSQIRESWPGILTDGYYVSWMLNNYCPVCGFLRFRDILIYFIFHFWRRFDVFLFFLQLVFSVCS